MKYIISGTNLKQVDKYTIDTVGIPSLVLMERAALSVVDEILPCIDRQSRIEVICGTGNNGADGVAIARILCNKGYHTCVYFLGNKEKATEEFKMQISVYEKIGGEICKFDCQKLQGDIIVDAILGIGLSRDVEGVYRDAIERINESKAKVFSVDVPSGINADTGKVMGVAVEADITVTFGMNKTGIVLYPGADYAGNIVIKEIGFSKAAFDTVEYYKSIEKSDYNLIPKRTNASNKGTYGKLFVIAGNDDMSGAAYMCAKASFRMGIGMVKIFTTKGNEELLKTMLPEAMVTVYDSNDYKEKLLHALAWCDVVAAGPGIGIGSLQIDMIDEVLKSKIPCVIDADGINCISQSSELKERLHNRVIITPHVGEMSKFTGITINEIKSDIINVAKENALKYGITVVLKDARTIISDGTEVFVNVNGNNGMSTAGSGDVLTGIIATVLAKKVEPIITGALAVYLHGEAGDRAAERLSKTALMATDMLDELIEISKYGESV